jgi:hypothetical protein
MSRLMDGSETWPEKAGRECRFVDAHYLQVGREPTKLRFCIGLYRSFEDSGALGDGVREAMELVSAGLSGRKWTVGERVVGQVMRQLKLID